MIKIENVEVMGWEHAIRGMRNPKNSWERSDSGYQCPYYQDKQRVCDGCKDNMCIGDNDHKLMMQLASGGAVHAKYRRMITVYLDITAPLYWWKEFDTYKVGTVANSCSTMHKIHDKEFTLEDFSCEHLRGEDLKMLEILVDFLNCNRRGYLDTKNKETYWWPMIQLLPSSYNQKRTIMLNYEVLAGMYESRKDHKLDEWREFCNGWIKSLPYSEIITGGGVVMTENERIIMEATLEELKAAEDDAKHYCNDMFSDKSIEIILAAIRTYIEAREMYEGDGENE